MKKCSKLQMFLYILFGLLFVAVVSIGIISVYKYVHRNDTSETEIVQASEQPLEERIFVSTDGSLGVKSQYDLDNKLVSCTTFKPYILNPFPMATPEDKVEPIEEQKPVEEPKPEPTPVSTPKPTPKPTSTPTSTPEPVVEKSDGRVLGSNFTLSHFCTCAKCCGRVGQATASGRMPEQNVTVAVDPRVIKLGTRLKIEIPDGNGGYVVYRANARADDTGGAIKGNKIDVLVNEHQEALNLGLIHNARVTILED